MRFLFGVLVGIGLTIGGAYLYDSSRGSPDSTNATSARPMVNWDVVDNVWNRATSRVQKEWDRLAAK
jgi:hypothetical protein